MYFVVEIGPNGSETFLEAFEDSVAAWDLARTLQLKAQKYRQRVRYNVR